VIGYLGQGYTIKQVNGGSNNVSIGTTSEQAVKGVGQGGTVRWERGHCRV